MANIEDEVPRRMMKRLYPASRKHDADVSIQILIAEQALKNILPLDLKKAWSGGGGGATTILVPSPEWVPHVASVVEDICDELRVHMKVDGKKRDEHSSAIARALGHGKGVVAISCQRRSKNRPLGGAKVGHWRCERGRSGGRSPTRVSRSQRRRSYW